MRNLWLVAQHEYRRTVVRRGFLIGALAVPLGVAVLIGLVILMETFSQNRLPIGYVDYTGALDMARQADLPNLADRIPIRAFADEASAQAALESEAIQAFFVLPEDYPESLATDLYYLQRPPNSEAWQDFDDFLRLNLAATLPAEVQTRVLAGPDIIVRDLGSGREFSEKGIINIILPVVTSALLFVNLMSASGYLLRVVADEKENRTMEIVLTSLTPRQLIMGKTLGLLGAVLTQMAIYLLALLLGIWVTRHDVPELQQIEIPWAYLGLLAAFFLPTFALLTAATVAVGAAMPDAQQGQQAVGLLSLTFMAPLFMMSLLMEDPSHPAIIFLSLFPTSAFLTIAIRWGLGVVPVWQIVVSWLMLMGSVLGLTWAAAQIFRAGMLRYGNPLSIKGMLAALRGTYGVG